jgi:hypothetical protein
MRRVGERHPHILGLPARITAGQVRVAEQARRRMAEHLGRDIAVAVSPFANGEVAAFALVAVAAKDRERNDDPVARLELLVLGADFHHLAHELVAYDVAGLHAWHEAVVEMQIGTANRAARHLDDGVARVLDLRIRNSVATDVLFPVPAQRSHPRSPIGAGQPLPFGRGA